MVGVDKISICLLHRRGLSMERSGGIAIIGGGGGGGDGGGC